MSSRKFRVGDMVWVRAPGDILQTLDGEGTLDGVPFMPEMLDWCGKSFRVLRRVEKVCAGDDDDLVRCFPEGDVVILDAPRCDGRAHDGCGYGCRMFWKEAWLQPVDDAAREPKVSADGIGKLQARLKTKFDDQRYFCQLTELYKTTRAFAGTRRFSGLLIALREIRDGDVSILRIFRLYAHWFLTRELRALGADRWVRGHCKYTPDGSLGLRSGDKVRIKSRARIVETLNPQRRNRGMGFSYEMSICCGCVAEVDRRVDRVIYEKTGEMRELSHTVTLRNIGGRRELEKQCRCMYQVGDCPRAMEMFWREIWLERDGADSRSFLRPSR